MLTGNAALRIALINNMPDLVLSETESQFSQLLEAASGDEPVSLSLFSLPGVPRSLPVQQRMAKVYRSLDELLNSRFDAVIVTGTEPRQPDLRKESYWADLAKVLDWAQENTVSTILSCLAAHAGVLYSDGIPREPLPAKQFGVFEFRKTRDHALIHRTPDVLRFPHSRWNEVRAEALTSCGYTVLTQSATAGVDLFVKKKRKSLFVHFQGHPEYEEDTLLREYARDAKRFHKGTRDTHPSLPHGYLIAPALENHAENIASLQPRNTWRREAQSLYRNWLQYVLSKKVSHPASSVVSPAEIHSV